MCVIDMCVGVCMPVIPRSQRRRSGALLYQSLAYFFERGSLIETDVGLWSASPSKPFAHSPSLCRAGVKGVSGHGWISMCLLKIQSQVLMLAHVIYPVSKLDFNYKDNSGLRRKRVYKKMSNKI